MPSTTAAPPTADGPKLRRTLADIPAAERIAPGVLRLPLPSPTLPPATTTNHYLVGAVTTVLVDPATPHPASQRRLIAVMAAWQREVAPIEAILLTHHHRDHIAATTALAAEFQLPVLAHAATARLLAGRLQVDRIIDDSVVVARDPDGPWIARHTPGHAPGHLILHGPNGGMIVGDMVAGQGTILIDPADGDMGLYLQSLRQMQAMKPTWLAPAHGPVLHSADHTLQHYIDHRLARESRILAALPHTSTVDSALLATAYGDVAKRFWPLALRSMRAHLVYLCAQGLVEQTAAQHWRRVDLGK